MADTRKLKLISSNLEIVEIKYIKELLASI